MSADRGRSPIEFWFSFGSPYAYFGALQIEALAARHGREVLWRPFVLGPAFKQTGMGPLTRQPMRGEYALRDWARLARLHQVPFVLPANFPVEPLPAGRMFYAVDSEDPAAAKRLAVSLVRAFFGQGLDIADAETAAGVGEAQGLDRSRLAAAAGDQRWKDALRARTDEALSKGVFGAPFVLVDGEPFWGADRLAMVEQWLARGGW